MNGKPAWLGLGSNLGDREQYLANALDRLDNSAGIKVEKVSALYQTPPWGPVPQGDFLNACTELRTSLDPAGLLARCKELEQLSGRTDTVRWGPRTLDIDVLAMEEIELSAADIELPHPRIVERCFVLTPLNDIAAELVIKGNTVANWLAAADCSEIECYKAPNWWPATSS